MTSLRWRLFLVVGSIIIPAVLSFAGLINPVLDIRSLSIFISVFFGSVVVGAAGFGSAVVGGAIMLFWLSPISAVPVLNAASFTTQIISIGQLWRSLKWRGGIPLILGGLVGIPAGVYLLQNVDPDEFRFAFGLFLVTWSIYLLCRPRLRLHRQGPMVEGLVGWIGGLTGGAIAFPGALPAIWCALTRETKEEQRGTIQIFILVVQIGAMIYLIMRGLVGYTLISDYIKMLPAIMIGTFVGVYLFGKMSEVTFRRLVLFLLLIVGIMHSSAAAVHLFHAIV